MPHGVGFENRPAGGSIHSRPRSGILEVEADGGFTSLPSTGGSRPPSRGDVRTLSRPPSGIIKVDGDGVFDSRPPSRGDMRPTSRPHSGIIKIEGDGGFDPRPPSSGDVRPGSRPLSGIIKFDSLNSPYGEGDSMASKVDKKKRLKSASRVTFPKAPGAVHMQTFSEHDMSWISNGEVSFSDLHPVKISVSQREAKSTQLPPVHRDDLASSAAGGAKRLGALFLGRHAFKISDYIRASDAKLGMTDIYNPTKGKRSGKVH